MQSKINKAPFPQSGAYRVTERLEGIHSNVCGPINTLTAGGGGFFNTFLDDFSRFCIIYLLSKKSDGFKKILKNTSLQLKINLVK